MPSSLARTTGSLARAGASVLAPPAAQKASVPRRPSSRNSSVAKASVPRRPSSRVSSVAAPGKRVSWKSPAVPQRSAHALTASDVYVRIRPQAESGGHAEGGIAAPKTLQGWTDRSVALSTEYMFSQGSTEYAFPQKVFAPDVEQQEVYDTMMPDLVEAFTRGDGTKDACNVMFLAYGQTGTGKTHTIFGEEASLRFGELQNGWGIFPRVCDAVFRTMADRGDAAKFILTVSAIEFYMMQCVDLLNGHAPVLIDDEHTPQGSKAVEVRNTGELLQILAAVQANRTSRGTKMNASSSRSHCALVLTLMQVGPGGKFTKTSFTLVDLAGAERPSKTGERVDVMSAFFEVMKGGEPSVGSQGTIINFELTMMRNSVVASVNAHRSGSRYIPDRFLTTPLIKFVSGCLTGKQLLGMVVTLSPVNQNGWETWFSLEYGKDLASLQVPLQAVKEQEIKKLAKSIVQALQKAEEDLSRTPESGAPSSKYYALRKALATSTAEFVRHLDKLISM